MKLLLDRFVILMISYYLTLDRHSFFFETMLYVTLLEIVILVRILIMIVAFRWDCTPSYR